MTKKEIAKNFLELTSKGDSKRAFDLYASDGFKHHNAWFKGDSHSLMTAMEENAKNYPELALDILRVLEDGNLVAVHSRVKMTTNDLGMALIHIFRFENHKIVELWDFGQAVPKDMVNENGMF